MSTRADLDRSYAICEQIARTYAHNFYQGFRLLPRAKRRAICAVYAFMRQADDLADEHGTPDISAIEEWHGALESAISGASSIHPVIRALADTVRRYDIPRTYFSELIKGVRSDLGPVSFSTFSELEDYCYKVAGVVGLVCLRIWGVCDARRADSLAIRCGTAFQLTNILRDLREDCGRGRVYLPEEDLHRHGLSGETLLNPEHAVQARSLIAFETERARKLYDGCRELPALISPDSRAAFMAMFLVYRALLYKIASDPGAPLERRVSLSAAQKLATLASALIRSRRDDPLA